MHWVRITSTLAMLALAVISGCGPSTPTETGRSPTSSGSAAQGPKRITMVVPNEPSILYYPLAPLATRGSAGLVYWFLGTGLALADGEGVLHPLLSEQVPTIENGLWKILPDGGMETTWKIRSGAKWHDGTPFTSDDLTFTLQVAQDR